MIYTYPISSGNIANLLISSLFTVPFLFFLVKEFHIALVENIGIVFTTMYKLITTNFLALVYIAAWPPFLKQIRLKKFDK
jgi:hypothetical protein